MGIDLFSEVKMPRIVFAAIVLAGFFAFLFSFFLYSAMKLCDEKAKAAGMSWSFGEGGCKLEPKP